MKPNDPRARWRRPRVPRLHAATIALLLLAAWLLAVPADRARLLDRQPSRAGGPPPGAERATVRTVIDGDTLVLEDGRTVRLLGIDTPETVHPDMDGPQPFGAAAAERTRTLAAGRAIRLERDVSDTDHYGRSLRHVWLGRELLARTLLAEGLGHAQSIPPDVRHAELLRAAEAAARDARRGLWGGSRPTPLPIFAAPRP